MTPPDIPPVIEIDPYKTAPIVITLAATPSEFSSYTTTMIVLIKMKLATHSTKNEFHIRSLEQSSCYASSKLYGQS